MRVRIKFSKEGCMRFIGHLDVMRYFQKALRRAQIDVAFSAGFSPHMIMSFAAPLGVGISSTGEYFDLDINTPISSKDAVERLNKVMVSGIKILSVHQVSDEKKAKAMTVVGGADYLVNFRPGMEIADWKEKFPEFMAQSEIRVMKETKKSEKEMDIRPWVHKWEIQEDGLFLRVSCGSVNNLKPELLLQAFASFCDVEPEPFWLLIHRIETYNSDFVSLEDLGEVIEL